LKRRSVSATKSLSEDAIGFVNVTAFFLHAHIDGPNSSGYGNRIGNQGFEICWKEECGLKRKRNSEEK
jgi:hypothetical protein